MNRFDPIRSPVFLLAVLVMSLNDFVLKAAFHNWITGKLSDFAGLAAFSLFCCGMFPQRRWEMAVGISIAFSWWKSLYSQSVIDFANQYLPFQIGRTVDYSDLIALPVVWLACRYAPVLPLLPLKQLQVCGIAIVSMAAFTGTSVINSYVVRETVEIGQATIPSDVSNVEAALQNLLDVVAEKRGMRCTVCDSLSKGRIYQENHADTFLILTANFDRSRSHLLYDIRPVSLNSPYKEKDIESLRAELQSALSNTYPSLKISVADYPEKNAIELSVWKKRFFFPELNQVSRDEYGLVLEIVAKAAKDQGLQRESDSLFSAGRLFGPSKYHRDLTVTVDIANQSTVAKIGINCYSPECMDRQPVLTNLVEQRLKAAFGEEWVTIRFQSRP